MNLLQSIHGHNDLIGLNETQRTVLCQQLRDQLVSGISRTGGHLASNLGVVELTVALETVFDTASDRLIFDVGHQSYVHKLLTGRQAEFASLRQFGGMAGFPKPSESNTDAFVAGHASSAVSIAIGMARARTLCGDDYHVIALLGDGAATGSVAFEGMNDAAVSGEPMIVILNDNAMSIDRNVGGMASHLSKLRAKVRYLGMKRKYKSFLSGIPGGDFIFRITRNIKDALRRMLIPSTIFESMGFTYLGPVDGHDTEKLISLLRIARDMKRPVLLHVLTQKGRGYAPAEEHPKLFHGVGKFDPTTGDVPVKAGLSFSDAFGNTMLQLAEQNNRLCAITAAMPGGTGLLEFKKRYPKRLFDVGIAEEHAVSMAGGLAKQGMVPVVALYSTFLQRAFDMMMQDVGLLGLHVIFAVDRAGLVGEDGETHHGVFDIGFMRQVPGMQILCPASTAELQDMLQWAVNVCDGPVALRYPRGTDGDYHAAAWDASNPVVIDKPGRDVAIITYGTMVNHALQAAAVLDAGVIRITKIHPLPVDALAEALAGYRYAVVLEETADSAAIYAPLAWALGDRVPQCHISRINLGQGYTTHGAIDKLYEACGLTPSSIVEHIQEVLKVEN